MNDPDADTDGGEPPLSEAGLAQRFASLRQGAAQLTAELRRPDGAV